MTMKPATQKKLLIALVLAGGIAFVISMLLVGAVVIARVFYLDPYIMGQNGMYPTKPKYSRSISLRKPYNSVLQVKRGDLVVFAQTKERSVLKVIGRVIGLPGDTVQQVPSGELKVNDKILPLAKVREVGALGIFLETNDGVDYEVAYKSERSPLNDLPSAVVVGEDELFCVGDNRDNSYDSRAYGPIPFSSVRGKVIW